MSFLLLFIVQKKRRAQNCPTSNLLSGVAYLDSTFLLEADDWLILLLATTLFFRSPPCEDMAEVRVSVRDAGVSGSWEAVLRFF